MRGIRIGMESDRGTGGWCEIYESPNHNRRVAYRSFSGSGVMSFDPPSPNLANGMVGLTARCFMFPGTSITSISIVWDL